MSKTISSVLIKKSCAYCKKPVYAAEGYHTITLDHFDCHKQESDFLNKYIENIETIKKPHRPRVKAGQGKLAQHVKRLVVVGVEQLTGESVREASLWLQQGVYRGPHWDLDSWGVDARLGEGQQIICCSSLATMRVYKKNTAIILKYSGINHYDIYAS